MNGSSGLWTPSVHDAREKWNRPAVWALPPWLGKWVPCQSLPGVPSKGPSSCKRSQHPRNWDAPSYPHCWLKGWLPPHSWVRCFHTQAAVLHVEVGETSLQLKNLYQPGSCPSSTCDRTVMRYIPVCYRPEQTTSESTVLLNLGRWGGVIPMDLQRSRRHGDQMVVNVSWC